MKLNINTRISAQRGAVLVTSLVFMAILTVIAVATMRSTTMDINILNNMQSRNNAFQCAEAALRAGEIWLDEKITSVPERVTTLPDQTLNTQVWDYKADAIQDISTKNLTWWQANGWTYGNALVDAEHQVGCAEEPRFIVEALGTVGDGSGNVEIESLAKSGVDYFRITAFSVGVENNTSVLLQTTFAKRLR
jgi:type IV pilus assembly protein PilX